MAAGSSCRDHPPLPPRQPRRVLCDGHPPYPPLHKGGIMLGASIYPPLVKGG